MSAMITSKLCNGENVVGVMLWIRGSHDPITSTESRAFVGLSECTFSPPVGKCIASRNKSAMKLGITNYKF